MLFVEISSNLGGLNMPHADVQVTFLSSELGNFRPRNHIDLDSRHATIDM